MGDKYKNTKTCTVIWIYLGCISIVEYTWHLYPSDWGEID